MHLRDDLNIKDIRGNVDTRLEKLDAGQYDAIVLAAAGLKRLGLDSRIGQLFDTQQIFPAVGQGALGIETRKEISSDLSTALGKLKHDESFAAAMAERHMLRRLFAGCLAPVGALTTMSSGDDSPDGELSLEGVVLGRDGKTVIKAKRNRPPEQFEALGIEVAEALLASGAEELLRPPASHQSTDG